MQTEMPDYLKQYKPGDTVPLKVWLRACKTCSSENLGWESDAAFYGLSPDPEEHVKYEREQMEKKYITYRRELKKMEAVLEI